MYTYNLSICLSIYSMSLPLALLLHLRHVPLRVLVARDQLWS